MAFLALSGGRGALQVGNRDRAGRAAVNVQGRKTARQKAVLGRRGDVKMQITQILVGAVLNSVVLGLRKYSESGKPRAHDGDSEEDWDRESSSRADKRSKPRKLKIRSQSMVNLNGGRDEATAFLILLNLVCFGLYNVLHLPVMSALVLTATKWHWWQFVTAMFMHNDWHHLSSNLFLLFFFGRLVEEEEGGPALIFIHLFCGVVSNIVCVYLAAKQAIFLGSSGAIFGLFAVCVLVRFRLSWKRLVEFFVLGNFVAATTLSEVGAIGAKAVRRLGPANAAKLVQVNHLGHIAGAFAGVALFVLVRWVLKIRKKTS